jgi:hypothetical protein
MEVLLLPKFHKKEVGEPVEVLVNLTVNGLHPEILLAVKFATGACAQRLIEAQNSSNSNGMFRGFFKIRQI